MALTYGFYNSLIGQDSQPDRVYDAVDFAKIFSGIITDGVIPQRSWGGDANEMFRLKASSGLSIAIGTGRAWFDDTWTHNDSDYEIILQHGHQTMTRIDAIVLTVDKGNRINSLGVIEGTNENGGLGSNPTVPSVASGYSTINNYLLGYVTLGPGATSITQDMITQSPIPYVTCPLDFADLATTGLYEQWKSQFNIWFDSVKDRITELDAATLQDEIDAIIQNGVAKLTNTRKIDGINFNGTANVSHYGECTTASGTADKTVSVSNYTLTSGAYVIVRFVNANTADLTQLTLNVNSTGKKPIRYRGLALSGSMKAGLYLFAYDGTNYELLSAGIEDTSLQNYVPTSRTINNKQLTGDITLYGSDINVSSSNVTKVDVAIGNKVDKVSGKGLSTNDFTNAYKSAVDISVPNTRTVNNKPLSANISLNASDVGAVSTSLVNTGGNTPEGKIPKINTDGVIELGNIIDFHWYETTYPDGRDKPLRLIAAPEGLRISTASEALTGNSGKLVVYRDFVEESYALTYSLSIGDSGNASANSTLSISKDGYFPLMLTGWDNGQAAITPYKILLRNRAVGSGVIEYGVTIRNGTKNTSISDRLAGKVMWVKV